MPARQQTTSKRKARRYGKIALVAVCVIFVVALALGIAWNTYEIRSAIRWRGWSRDYKARVLAQPASAGGLKHTEWDGWGWGGQDTTVYLVFDPSDSLSAAASSRKEGKYDSIPCEVYRIRRLESHWYTVQMYTNGDCWS